MCKLLGMRYNLYLIIFCLFIPEIYANNQACIQVNRVTLRGVSNCFSSQIHNTTNQLPAVFIANNDLQQFMQQISNYYSDNNYIPSLATIPEQNLNNDELIVEVIKGYIENIAIRTEGKRALFIPMKTNNVMFYNDG